MILSIHIRKCAGTTFREGLRQALGNAVLFDYGDQIGSSWPSSIAHRQVRLRAAMADRETLAGYQLIHGHYYPDKYRFLRGPKSLVTFMRDPVERLLSNYAYLKRNSERKHPDALIVHALGFSLAEFAEHPDNRNFQSQCLQTTTLSEYAFVGLVEDYAAEVLRLNKALGLTVPQVTARNVNPDATGGYALPKAERIRIENANLDDLRLYDIARRRSANLETV